MTSITLNEEDGGAVVRADRRGRLLIKAEQREALLREFDRGGLSGMAFCRLHGLAYPTFASWVRKRREQLPPGTPAFAEVLVDADARAGAASPCPRGPRILLPGGIIIETGGRDQVPVVAELLRALGVRFQC